jgi:nitrogen fixation protein FixH
MSGPFTGRHMTAILIAFFAVVVAVNVAMARYASSTFGGVVVENSYVASQHFNRWLNEAAKEDALGLHALVTRTADDRLSVALSGADTTGVSLVVTARHPLGRTADRTFRFTKVENGRFVSREALPPGRWRLRLALGGSGRAWRTEQEIF